LDIVQFANKWLHLLSIIGAFGGIMFAWIVLRTEPDEDGARLRWRRWGIAQAVFWVVVLVTGFANYAFVSPGVVGRYHMLIGMKIMLVILMFIIVLALGHPIPGLSGLARNRATWLTALIVMGVAVVGISAYLNIGRVKRSLTKTAVEAPPMLEGVAPSLPAVRLPGAASP